MLGTTFSPKEKLIWPLHSFSEICWGKSQYIKRGRRSSGWLPVYAQPQGQWFLDNIVSVRIGDHQADSETFPGLRCTGQETIACYPEMPVTGNRRDGDNVMVW